MRAIALLGPNATADDVAPFAAAAQVAILTSKELTGSPDAALVFGGDGTVHRHLRGLVDSNIPVLVVPMGSGNDFARAIGMNSRRAALAAWQEFCKSQRNVRAIDVAEIAPTGGRRSEVGNLFCCVAGAGIDADVNRRANQLPRWLRAHGGYALSVMGAAISFRPQRLTVQFENEDGSMETISEPALMCAFANASSYGHGMKIAPPARLDDGLLDLIFVRRAGPLRLLTVFPKVYFGAHMDLPEIEHRRVSRLQIGSETPLDIYADGEFICQTPADVTVRPQALKVIC